MALELVEALDRQRDVLSGRVLDVKDEQVLKSSQEERILRLFHLWVMLLLSSALIGCPDLIALRAHRLNGYLELDLRVVSSFFDGIKKKHVEDRLKSLKICANSQGFVALL